MNILLMDAPGSPAITLDADYWLNHWLWNTGKFTKFSAYFDLIFRSDTAGNLKTTTDGLARRWGITHSTAYQWLRTFKKRRLIDYDYESPWLYITILTADPEGMTPDINY